MRKWINAIRQSLVMKVLAVIVALLLIGFGCYVGWIYSVAFYLALLARGVAGAEVVRAHEVTGSLIAAIIPSLVLIVTVWYVIETRRLVNQSIKQYDEQQQPAVSIRVTPNESNPQFLNIVLKNTGGGPAYDVVTTFTPDVRYGNGTLGALPVFKKLAFLDKGESVSFVYAYSPDLPAILGDNGISVANIQYFRSPRDQRNDNAKPDVSTQYELDFSERIGQTQLALRSMDDLVNEVESLRHAIALSLVHNIEIQKREIRKSRRAASRRRP